MRKLLFSQQVAASVVIGLLVGVILKIASPAYNTEIDIKATPVITSPDSVDISALHTETGLPRPFTTLDGVWFLKIHFYRNSPPKILKVEPLATGRISTYSSGEYRLLILNEGNVELYELPFSVTFLKGEPPRPVDELEMVFVIPRINGEQYIKLETLEGSSVWKIQ